MYGWRDASTDAPYDNAVIEPEFAQTLPLGVTAHVVRTTRRTGWNWPRNPSCWRHDAAPARERRRLRVQCQQLHPGRAWHDAFSNASRPPPACPP